ncbi:MAG TPA: glycosyltransferase family 39 protein [Candidatus Solibacter sp.]|nr:glycosyltransferase family 39 protein [Candidatus Solibacter sp.]
MPRRLRSPSRWLLAIWLCFLGRGLFCCLAIPLWEGFDEYSHFSYVQHVDRGAWLIHSGARATREVEHSIEIVPMPWTLRGQPPPHETYESYWRLPPEVRRARERELFALTPSAGDALSTLPSESQQPPLSYWLMAMLYNFVAGLSLPAQVLALRLLNLLLTSAAIPAAWMAARRVFPDAPTLATGIAALVALFPEMMFDGARVSNSALSIALFSAFAVLGLDVLDARRHAAIWLGASLGLGLLTKGFFLGAVPVFVALLAWTLWKRTLKVRDAIASLALAAAIPGWWYVHNLRTTGSFSTSIQEANLHGMPLFERLRHIRDVHWFAALDSTFFSHIWFGGWSFLQLRAWIYHVFALLAVLAIIGLAIAWRRRDPRRDHLALLATIYALFCVGIAYHVLLTYLANGISSSAGWYLCSVIVPETVLFVAGFRAYASRAINALPAALAILDVYGLLFVALPYYTGLTAHKSNGFLEAFNLQRLTALRLAEIPRRLAANHSAGPVVIAVAGVLYLAATWFLVFAAITASSQTLPPQPKHSAAA